MELVLPVSPTPIVPIQGQPAGARNSARLATRSATTAGWILQAGIVVFSGSLYALSLTGVKGLGAITPLGGLAFLVGWGLLAWGAFRG